MLEVAVLQRFLPSRSRGGVGHFTDGLSTALARRGHGVTVFSQDPAPEERLYRVVRLPGGGSARAARLAPLYFPFQLAEQEFGAFDVIHAQGDEQLLPRSAAPPVVRTLHGAAFDEAVHNGWRRRSAKRFLMHLHFYAWDLLACLRADAVVAVSPHAARRHPRVDEVIPNGIDVARFSRRGEPRSERPSILFVGELDSRKRGRLLLEVVRERVQPWVPDVELWLVCPERADGEGVRWFGTVGDERLARLYREAWVFCLPSSYEGFGRPYVEAMAAGTPVVATPNPGAAETLENGRHGLVVGERALGEALCAMLTRTELREEYARRGPDRAKAYAWEEISGRYERLYESVLRNHRRRGRRPAGRRGAPGARSRAPEPVRARQGRAPHRVLYVQSTSEIGGSDITLLRTVEGLDRSRVEPQVVLPGEGPLVEAFERAGCRVHFLPSMRKLTSRKGLGHLLLYLGGYPFAVARLRRLIRRERIGVVHTNSIHNLYGFLAARLSRRPHVWHVREIVVQSSLLRRLETWLVRRFSTRILVMSDAIAASFRDRRGRLPRNLVKLYDGLDLNLFHPAVSGERVRGDLGIDPEAPLVGTVCRLDAWKGVDDFLEAAAHVLEEMPAARFIVCGGEIEGHPGYENALRCRAESLGLRAAVRFTGWRYRHRDIPEVYAALDVSVQCPLYPEPYGLANVEAMACAVPIVAPARGGPAELCVHGLTAVLVPPGDPRATADAVLSLLRDRRGSFAMGAAGRVRAQELFDLRRCVEALERLYDGILEVR